jgi:DNA helicase IV
MVCPRRREAVTASRDELELEQQYVDRLYARLDELRERTATELKRVRQTPTAGTHQNRSERDAFAVLHEQRLAQLEAVEDRLAFGRLDLADDQRRYIGRLGLSDEHQAQLLVDWRAPAARSFYQATAASPEDVVRRRHLATRGRRVVAVEDEVLDLDAMDQRDRGTLNGEGALLAAVAASRTGRMADIVATIQAEQDRIIRADLAGVLVVQGGPGTGKTAVALHRAAYLLYTHRERLARSGVLLVGPNDLFMRYIEQVLPSLGETGVVMSTPGQLYPGLDAHDVDTPEVAALKGDERLAAVVAKAVRDRQRLPVSTRLLEVGSYQVELTPAAVEAARSRAQRSHRPHNLARVQFVREMLDGLARSLARALGTTVDDDNRPELIEELRDSRDVRREVNLAWMPLTPEQVIGDLYADPERLEAAAPNLSQRERALLFRERGAPWTVADVPLLDEAAELLGEDDTPARLAAREAASRRREQLDYARAVLRNTGGGDLISAETLAERFGDDAPSMSLAERAERDRSWSYGHVVVDEAQELSPMMWRLLMRRCPLRSMTLVGDIAQRGALGGARSWAEVLDPYAEGRWRLEQLTVNYRTPARVMRLAVEVLAAAGVDVVPPESVREGDWPPTADRIAIDDPDVVAAVVRAELRVLDGGRMAVLATPARADDLRRALASALPPGTTGDGHFALDAPVAVLSVAGAKGLEFDTVILIEPSEIMAASMRGANDLYVAITRPTKRLRVLHHAELPAGLDQLAGRDSGNLPRR